LNKKRNIKIKRHFVKVDNENVEEQQKYNTWANHIKKISIIGAGQMGTGIAIVSAQIAKRDVLVIDQYSAALEKSKSFAVSLLMKNVEKGKMTEKEKDETLKRIKYSANIDDSFDSNFIIEAVSENYQVKQNIFDRLSNTNKNVILGTNTSSISITKIAANVKK